MICSEGLVQPKLFKIFPKSMQVSMNPPHYQSWSFQFRKRCTLHSFNQFFVIESDRDTQKENTQDWDKNRTRGQQEAFFQFRDKNENFAYSIWHIKTNFWLPVNFLQFITFNLRLRDEWESKLTQLTQEILRMWSVACGWTDAFQNRSSNFLIFFFKIMNLLSLRNFSFRDESGNFFSISCLKTRMIISFFQSENTHTHNNKTQHPQKS